MCVSRVAVTSHISTIQSTNTAVRRCWGTQNGCTPPLCPQYSHPLHHPCAPNTLTLAFIPAEVLALTTTTHTCVKARQASSTCRPQCDVITRDVCDVMTRDVCVGHHNSGRMPGVGQVHAVLTARTGGLEEVRKQRTDHSWISHEVFGTWLKLTSHNVADRPVLPAAVVWSA